MALPGKHPCHKCGSSDATVLYEDGGSHCFSCKLTLSARQRQKLMEAGEIDGDLDDSLEEIGASSGSFVKTRTVRTRSHTSGFQRSRSGEDVEEIRELPIRGFIDRGITRKVCEFFGVRSRVDEETDTILEHYYPLGHAEAGSEIDFKVREVATKEFRVVGKLRGLFGQRMFQSGKRLIITEGELDAMIVAESALQRWGSVYPVVSLHSATGDKEIIRQRDWVLGFEEIVLWFDNDEPGRLATDKVANILLGGDSKILVVKSNQKDACDVYKAASQRDTTTGSFVRGPGAKAVMECVFNATPWSPAGVVMSSQTWQAVIADNGEFFPFCPALTGFNERNYGRKLGSITLFTSGTGMGKTQLIKEDQHFMLKNRPKDELIGVMSLEEGLGEAVVQIMAIEANRRIHLPDVPCSDEEKRALWEATMADDRFMFLDHQGSVDDGTLISRMEYMALKGCKWLYLDHITIAVTESSDGKADINLATDKMMSDLLKLVKRRNIWIGVICHLRKQSNNQKSFEEGAVPTDDDLKGSGSLKQVPMQIIAIARNKMAEDPIERSTSYVYALKDRFTGRTGFKGAYRFHDDTGRCVYVDPETEFSPV